MKCSCRSSDDDVKMMIMCWCRSSLIDDKITIIIAAVMCICKWCVQTTGRLLSCLK